MTKLALPDGNSETAAVDVENIASVTIAFDEKARKVLMIILKNGGVVYAKCTDANIAYLSTIGLAPSQIPPSIKVALKP